MLFFCCYFLLPAVCVSCIIALLRRILWSCLSHFFTPPRAPCHLTFLASLRPSLRLCLLFLLHDIFLFFCISSSNASQYTAKLSKTKT